MDSLPWPAITAASGGWVLFGITAWTVLRMVLRDELVSGKRLAAAEERLKKAETAAAEAVAQNGELMEWARLGRSTFQALNRAALEET